MEATADHRQAIFDHLSREGLLFDRVGSSDDYVLSAGARGRFIHVPVLTIPLELLDEYLSAASRMYDDRPDPALEALSMAVMHVGESLTSDHGDGMNATTALGFRRADDGSVEFYVHEDRLETSTGTGGDMMEWVADPPG
ncbi:MAG: hypothetical protein ACR2GH_16530 [Pseudonocardia sp.]